MRSGQVQSINIYKSTYIPNNNKLCAISNPYHSRVLQKSASDSVSFGQNFLTRIDGMICPCCGIKMTTTKKFNSRLKEAVLSGASKKAVEVITEFEPNLHRTEARCFTILKKLSKKNPDKTLQELIIMESPKHLYHLQLRQLRILDQIDIHTKELPPDIKENIEKISTEARSTINQETAENIAQNQSPFKRKAIINSLEAIKNAYPDNKILEEIHKISLRLPNSSNDVDSFFVKYTRRSPSEIGQRLVTKSQSTIEHILPQSEDGKNLEGNYLGECAGCNNSRGSILLNDWIAANPQMLKNLRIYMRQVALLINSGEIIAHDNYMKKVIATIRKETLGNEYIKAHPRKKLVAEFKALIYDLNKIADDADIAA